MTYADAIKKLLKKAGDELIYPVNICDLSTLYRTKNL